MGTLCGLIGDGDDAIVAAMARTMVDRAAVFRAESRGCGHLGGRFADTTQFHADRGRVVAVAGSVLLRGEAGPEPVSAAEIAQHYQTEGPAALDNLDGAFALAIWNAPEERLVLARDLFGVCPIYASYGDGWVAFASEYKALLTLPRIASGPDRKAIQYFLAHGWPPADRTLHAGIVPIMPGTALVWTRIGHRTIRLPPRPREYRAPRRTVSPRDVSNVVRRSVEACAFDQKRRYGISLSGGIDSALIAAELNAQACGRPIHSFTVGYGDEDPEIVGARRSASAVGTVHHELIVSPYDLPAMLDEAVWVMEEPGGYDEYPCLYLLAQEAGRYVDVLFSGNVSDSLFAGMSFHWRIRQAARLPGGARLLAALQSSQLNNDGGRTVLSWLAKYILGDPNAPPSAKVVGLETDAIPCAWRPHGGRTALFESLRDAMETVDGRMGVQEAIARSAGLDFRMPYALRDVAQLALLTPDDQKVRGRHGKYILRQAAAAVLPHEAAWRKKGIQQLRCDEDLSTVLDSLADKYLTDKDTRRRGLLEPDSVSRLRRRSGPRGRMAVKRLWNAIAIEAWARRFLDRRSELLMQRPVELDTHAQAR